MTTDAEFIARLNAADELAQLGKRIAADLATILRTARSLADPSREIGRAVGTLRTYEGKKQAYSAQAATIAGSLDNYLATSKKTREREKAKRGERHEDFLRRRAEIEKLEDAGVPQKDIWRLTAEMAMQDRWKKVREKNRKKANPRHKDNVVYIHQ